MKAAGPPVAFTRQRGERERWCRGGQKSTGLSAGDKRSAMQGSIAALQPRMVDGHARVTGDLCAIVRVPPLVHTRLVIGSAHLSLSLSPLSIPYVPTSIDKSISLPSPASEGQICSANIIRKIEKSKHDPNVAISLSLSSTRYRYADKNLSVCRYLVSRDSHAFLKILESCSDPAKTWTGKMVPIVKYFPRIVEGSKRGLVDPRGRERVAGNHVSTKRLVSFSPTRFYRSIKAATSWGRWMPTHARV